MKKGWNKDGMTVRNGIEQGWKRGGSEIEKRWNRDERVMKRSERWMKEGYTVV